MTDKGNNTNHVSAKRIAENKAGIKDEICVCGHLLSEHSGIKIDPRDQQNVSQTFTEGHGCCSKCQCLQFTWKAWVYDRSSSHFKELKS